MERLTLKDMLRMYLSASESANIAQNLPGKDCGLCGFRTCAEFAAHVAEKPEEISRCIFVLKRAGCPAMRDMPFENMDWKDVLGREYDFILDKHAREIGPLETIQIFNPANIEKLGIRKGDVVFGRPAAAGCPVTHCGEIVEEPDYFNGILVWCIIGPMEARERGINIGMYNPIAYEGLVRHPRTELRYGMRYHFLPRYCMLQARHSGVLNLLVNTEEGLHARMEGIILG